jgi:hypothetical protein
VLEPAALEKAMPREQEQTLTIEKKLLEAPAASEFGAMSVSAKASKV